MVMHGLKHRERRGEAKSTPKRRKWLAADDPDIEDDIEGLRLPVGIKKRYKT
jgi:hypothetical protein